MIFNEVFGAYTRTIGSIINASIKESQLSWSTIRSISDDTAFKESADFIRGIINPTDGDSAFPLIKSVKKNISTEYSKVLEKPYHRPITDFELRWLKTISSDPRVKLFCDNFPELNDVEPLFNLNDIIYYDQDFPGDDFENPLYIENFRTILKAIHNKCQIEITDKENKNLTVIPINLEYSQKDHRFRMVISTKEETIRYVRLSSISQVSILNKTDIKNIPLPRFSNVVLNITDMKNVMERICLSFSHLERVSERIDKSHYNLTVTFDESDKAEMIIRIMSFGSFVRVIEPQDMKEEIERRLKKQVELFFQQ